MRALLLSFLSPSGRIRRWPFWWRQLLLTVLLYPCCRLACSFGLQMFGEHFADMRVEGWIPSLLAQTFAPTCLASTFGSFEASWHFYYFVKCHHSPYLPTGFELLPGLIALLCYTIALLAGWSSLALMMRRMRDTRPGLRLLPLCLPLCYGLPLHFYNIYGAVRVADSLLLAAFGIPLIATLILSLLPSRKDKPGTAEKP